MYFYTYRRFEALANVLLKAWMAEILFSLLSVAPLFTPNSQSSTLSVSYKKNRGFVFVKISVQLCNFEKRAPFYPFGEKTVELASLSWSRAVNIFVVFFFFVCVPQRTRVRHVRLWKMLGGLCLCLHLTLSAVFRPFTDFKQMDVYTSCVDNGDQQEPLESYEHGKRNDPVSILHDDEQARCFVLM